MDVSIATYSSSVLYGVYIYHLNIVCSYISIVVCYIYTYIPSELHDESKLAEAPKVAPNRHLPVSGIDHLKHARLQWLGRWPSTVPAEARASPEGVSSI